MRTTQVVIEAIGSSTVIYNADYQAQLLSIASKHSVALAAEQALKDKLASLKLGKSPASELAKQIEAEVQSGEHTLRSDLPTITTKVIPMLPSRVKRACVIQANLSLLETLNSHAKPGVIQYVANATERQGLGLSLRAMANTDTHCIFEDILTLVERLSKMTRDQHAVILLNPLLLSESTPNVMYGEHYHRIISGLSYSHQFGFNDSSRMTNLYYLAHECASNHEDKEITLNYYDDNNSVHEQLYQQLIQYPDFLPHNVTVILGQQSITGRGRIDKLFQENVNKLYHLARTRSDCADQYTFALPSLLGINDFLAERQQESMPKKALAVLLDADDCLYNPIYNCLMYSLIIKFDARLMAIKHENDQQLIAEMKNYIATVDISKFNHRKKVRLRTEVELMVGGRPVSAYYAAFKTKRGNDNGQAVVAQYIINILNADQSIIYELILRANERLFADMIKRAELTNCKEIVLLCGSNRQSKDGDAKNAVHNGSGLFLNDLKNLPEYLNVKYQEHQIEFKTLLVLMPDYYNNLSPGETWRRHNEGLRNPNSAWVFDETKFSILYTLVHYLARRLANVTDVVFYDDRKDILNSLINIFDEKDSHALLPQGVKVSLVRYSGKFKVDPATHVVHGSGPLDDCLHATVALFAKLCKLTRHEIGNKQVNMADLLEFDKLLKARQAAIPSKLKLWEMLTIIQPQQRSSATMFYREALREVVIPSAARDLPIELSSLSEPPRFQSL